MPGFGQKTQTIQTDGQLEQELARKKAELSQVAEKVNEVALQSQEIEDRAKDLEVIKVKQEKAALRLEETRNDATKIEKKWRTQERKLEQAAVALQKLKDEQEKRKVDLEELKKDLSDTKREKDDTESEKRQIEKTIESLERYQRGLQERCDELEQKTEAKTGELKKVMDDLAGLQSGKDELEKTKHDLFVGQRDLKVLHETKTKMLSEISSLDKQKADIIYDAKKRGEEIIAMYQNQIEMDKRAMDERDGLISRKDQLLEEKKMELIRFKAELERHLGKPITSIRI